MKPTTRSFLTFLWRVTYSHTIAYWLAGVFAVTFLNYREIFASESLSMLMLPVDDPLTALGPVLQIVRGAILGAVLWLVRGVIFGRGGYWKLGVLVFGLSQVCTIGPTPGSFDGMIYTVLPLFYHLFGLPEAVLYIALQHYVSNHDVVIISTLVFGFCARLLALRLKLGLPVFYYSHEGH